MWPVDGMATIETEDGLFSGQDHFLVIRDALADETGVTGRGSPCEEAPKYEPAKPGLDSIAMTSTVGVT